MRKPAFPSARSRVSRVPVLALWAALAGPVVQAQDSFDNGATPAGNAKPPRAMVQPRPPEPAPAAAPRPAQNPAAPPDARPSPDRSGGGAAFNEAQDFGVKPTAQLRPSEQLHGATPTSIPGGKVVGTPQLAQWMQGQQSPQGKVMLLHAIASQRHLPNAIPVVPASQGGSFDDAVQRDFGNYLQQATGGDRGRLLVTYCAGVQCWGSYNAALRAIRMGYTNVHWYRGGIEAWEQAGLPVLTASAQDGQRPSGPATAPR